MRNIVAVIFALVVLASVFPVTAPAGTLAVPVITQQQEQWCWAGSCQMILSYYGYSATQCAMANWCFYQSTCCNNVVWPRGTGSSCNKPNWIFGYSRDMQDVLIHWGPIYGVGVSAALSWSTVQSESNAGRPFVIGFQWTGGGGHALVGRGYLGSNVYYNDPWPGEGYMYASYSWMVNGTGHVWDESYRLTSSPPSPHATRAPLQLFAGDFNGDSISDIAIFRPSTGMWSIRGVGRYYFGRSGDIPVPADYNGDGRADIAIFRPSNGLWSVRGVTRFYFGQSGDYPIPMNYRSGYATAGIFRPSTGLWSFRGGNRFYFGSSGDIPVIGPWKTRSGKWGAPCIAVFRPSTGMWSVRGLTRFYFGSSGDIPVPGAYSTSSTEPWKGAIFRPSTGLWSIRGRGRYYFGSSGDIPVPGDYNSTWGDEIAIFRPSTGLWSIRGGNRYYYGSSGDSPATR
ncbi:MAG: C39 family peptidase [Candidatus Erginobacter occultus]|nr:C39 family peptidase [Candidatus Erginobacter occultus]